MFHKEGHRIIIASFFFTISVIISSDILIGPENIKIILQSGFLFFYSMILWFFRNPKRNIIIDDNFYNDFADINNDSFINVIDIIAIVNIILDN